MIMLVLYHVHVVGARKKVREGIWGSGIHLASGSQSAQTEGAPIVDRGAGANRSMAVEDLSGRRCRQRSMLCVVKVGNDDSTMGCDE